MTYPVPLCPGRGRHLVRAEPQTHVGGTRPGHTAASQPADRHAADRIISVRHRHTARAGLHFGRRWALGAVGLPLRPRPKWGNVAGPPRTVGGGLTTCRSADFRMMTTASLCGPVVGDTWFVRNRRPRSVVRVPATPQHPSLRTDMRLIASSVFATGIRQGPGYISAGVGRWGLSAFHSVRGRNGEM